MTDTPRSPLQRRHRTSAVIAALVAVGMVGAAYAAVPLYRIFCERTGFDGTPRRANAPSQKSQEQMVVIRFDGNVSPDLPWRFEPEQTTMTVKLGENAIAKYRATNLSSKRITATATYNILPEIAASYFNKVQCFCFTEQTLEPGETAELAVSFFVDPDMLRDRDAKGVTTITLSYTFYPTATQGVAAKQTNKSG